MNGNIFYNLGIKMAAFAHNKKPQDIVALDGFNSAISDYKEPNYGYMQKFACRIAADAFAEAGRKDEIEYHVLHKLANAEQWFPAFEHVSDAVFKALGNIALEVSQTEQNAVKEALTKQASSLLSNAVAMTGRATPEAVKIMAGLGAIGGGVTGGLYWLLNRHSREDEDEAEVIKAKIDYYNRLSSEIKKQLGTADIPPAAMASKVRETLDSHQGLY